MLAQGIFGRIILENDRDPLKLSVSGSALFFAPVFRGIGLYGSFLAVSFADGFKRATLTIAELVEITCQDGSIARFTPHPTNISYGGHTWQAVPMRRGSIKMHTDLQVDKVELELGIIGLAVGTQSYTVPQLIQRGYLRQARVRIVAVDYEDLTWEKFRFDGYVTDTISYNAGTLSLQIGSILDRLSDKFPKLIYSEFCQHRLFDAYCGLNAAAYKVTGSIGAGTTARRIYAPGFLFNNYPQGTWVRGEFKVTDTGSVEYNTSRTIMAHGDGYVDLLVPFETAPVAGETFEVWPGCDKSGTTCASKFNNYANFLGFEYIPKPEILYG